jgi:hypothetical protein
MLKNTQSNKQNSLALLAQKHKETDNKIIALNKATKLSNEILGRDEALKLWYLIYAYNVYKDRKKRHLKKKLVFVYLTLISIILMSLVLIETLVFLYLAIVFAFCALYYGLSKPSGRLTAEAKTEMRKMIDAMVAGMTKKSLENEVEGSNKKTALIILPIQDLSLFAHSIDNVHTQLSEKYKLIYMPYQDAVRSKKNRPLQLKNQQALLQDIALKAQEHKIDLLVISEHGTSTSIQNVMDDISLSQIKLVQPNTDIILSSCSTGGGRKPENSIAAKIAEANPDCNVYAPKDDIMEIKNFDSANQKISFLCQNNEVPSFRFRQESHTKTLIIDRSQNNLLQLN